MKGNYTQSEDKISKAIGKLREIHTSSVDTTLSIKTEMEQVKKLSAPFMEQLGGENICRSNIDMTIASVQEILNEIKETDSYIGLLKSKTVSADAEKFLEIMERVKQLHTKFEEELIYFKDSYSLSQKLKEAIISGCEECETKFFQLLKILFQQKVDIPIDVEGIQTQVNRLVKIMERCKYYRYFDKYAESRRQKLRDIIDAKKMKSKFANPGPIRELYEKGSHHLVELLPLSAELFEGEKNLCDAIFAGMTNAKLKFVTIVTPAFQQISGMIDGFLDVTTENMGVNEMLLASDLVEALVGCYQKFFTIFGEDSSLFIGIRRQRQDLMQTLHDFLENLLKKIEAAGEVKPRNEEIDEITIETINFLSHFDSYTDGYKALLEWQKRDLRIGLCNEQIVQLVDTLESKGKLLSQRGTQIFFWLNNFSFVHNKTKAALDGLIVKSMANSGLEKRIKDLLAEYEEYTWTELIAKVFEESKLQPKKRLEEFNRKFKEIYHSQRIVKVVSSSLAKKMRKRNVELILPKYTELLKEVEAAGKVGKAIRYTASDLENALNEFFSST